MASRLLTNTLQANAGLTKQFIRSMATNSKQALATRITNLPNGLTVATEENPSAGAATVGVWIDAGSRAESAKTNGIANLFEHVALQGQASKFENIGGVLTAKTGREITSFSTKTLGSKMSESVEILADLIQNTKIDAATVDKQRQAVFKQQLAAENDYESVVFDHLYATAFQGESLGRPVNGIKETVEQITVEDLIAFQKDNYSADRMVIVGSGDVDHEALVRLAEKKFGGLGTSTRVPQPKPSFTGSEIRMRDDTLPQARIAFAVEGAPYLSKDYFNLLVMQAIIGAWDKNLGGAGNLSSKLSAIVNNNHLADSFASFTKGHKDTGLWGLYVVTQNRDQIDDFVHFLQKEWVRLSTTVTASEIECAKQQVKAGLLLSLDSTCAVADDIGSQVLTTGKRLSEAELKETIHKITADDVRKTAYKYVWDQELAVVGHGPVECLTDYNRVRGNMAYNRF
ncbi:Metalloenzyme, LuxS/M16 peptidase-like protein [Cokeromyces recurvatus]|uniref:Metalloenzyme, LuxS/M16 peptidase-like protein n=1 Tax=Cokeromyces recurvatus TaxID=90255 RepID=UPI002220D32A|nr:Metalloenzyme, LuxS/M16 peptidase-like protein [Cokeromyces recurvatus]KAI7899656.1 Metalloenzyme, LuxS/M16 peptidase-like protein [Cokeromyces recurvatus]